ncbi:hypothetical protein KAU33_13070 [Candidatus Dependentiae bacterium]|nr:hypothetical protein [Candidatus Dependentiae bacterium]
MKRSLAVVFILALLVTSAFGYSLRMETMGRISYALEDFETDVMRNPACISNLDQNYFRLSLGMEGAATEIETKYDEVAVGNWIGKGWDNWGYSSMPINILGFYKFGTIAIGLQFDMPSESWTYERGTDEAQIGGTDIEIDKWNDEFSQSITNFALTLGSKFGNFAVGLNFGQTKHIGTYTDEYQEDGEGVWDHDWDKNESDLTADNTFYGFGLVYPTGKLKLEFAYKMSSVLVEIEETKDDDYDSATDTTTTGDVADHDIYPIEETTLDSSLIHLMAKYKYTEEIDATAVVGIIVHNAEPVSKYSTFPDFTNTEVAINQTNIGFAVGFHKEKYKFGIEMDYNMFDLEVSEYRVDTWIPWATYKRTDITASAKMIIWKAGAEYQAMDKLTLRAGVIKYAPLSATMEVTNYNALGEITNTQETTYDLLNTGNFMVASFGFEYKLSNQMSLEYGYIGGKALLNLDALTLVTDLGGYAYSFDEGITAFTPMSFTTHKFSIKYNF